MVSALTPNSAELKVKAKTNLELQKSYDKLVEDSEKTKEDIDERLRAATVAEALRVQKAADRKNAKTKKTSTKEREQTASQSKKTKVARTKKTPKKRASTKKNATKKRKPSTPPGSIQWHVRVRT